MKEYADLKLTVASSPHVGSPVGTRALMMDVLVALTPALCMAVFFFGPRALALTAVSVVGCEIFEALYRILLKKPVSGGDLSAAVTGVLLAFVCPVTIPYWTILIGDFFAIVVVKQLFGGLGKNFLNPALAGRAFLALCYLPEMTVWVRPGTKFWLGLTASAVDAVSAATPMADLHNGLLPWLGTSGVRLHDMFYGNVGGCMGEVSALALLFGGGYLILRGVIHPRIPTTYLGTVALLAFLFPRVGSAEDWMLAQLLSGGLMLGAFFMATDYVTSPCTPWGEVLFGVGCGLLTVFLRSFGGSAEGFSYAILLMNACVPLLEKYTQPKRYGASRGWQRKARKEGEHHGKG